jgi:DNA polymerase-3 subunit alpha
MMDTHICASPGCTHHSHYTPLVNCHMHSGFSALDGAGKFEDYIELAKKFNIPGLALTDHGSATGIYTFYKQVKEAGLKPILGEEFYLTTDLIIRKPNRERELIAKDKHQTVLIKNAEGYKNFCKLNYLSFTEGYYYKPRVSYEMLFAHSKGLIITSGCAASIFNQLLMNGLDAQAEEWFKKFVTVFGDNFYGEIQFNELNDLPKFGMSQQMCNAFIIKMCNKYDIKIIIGGDTHYAQEEDSKLQDIFINCQRRKDGAATEMAESFIHARHLYFHNSSHYHKFNKDFGFNYDEKFINTCLQNSIELADRVDFKFETGKINYPKYTIPTKESNKDYCTRIAYEGLTNKLKEREARGEAFTTEQYETYEKRLDHEIEIISSKGYIDYFLIFEDIVKWSKSQGFYSGPARGSAGGSLLSYALDITEIDPVKFGLYFERFLNAERNSPPDIDWDIAQGGREKVREYLEGKYGKDSVFGVCTYGLYKAKSALQDASRGLGKDTSFESVLNREATKIDKLDDKEDLLEFFNELKDLPSCTPTLANWILTNQDTIYWAQKMLGQFKSLGTHAGGIVITPGPVYDYIPVAKGGGEIVTAFREADGSGKDLSELGLLKLDILGVKTLNILQDSIVDIKRDLGIDISDNIKHVDLNDKRLYEKFKKGNNIGIFQFESATIDGLCKSIDPDCFEDVVAINSINRPGPLENFAPVFGKWKHWEKEGNTKELDKIKDQRYPFPFMEAPLKETYGCLLYQEQFMLMVCEAAGFNMGEADSFRRAIGWNSSHPKYHTVKKYFDKLEAAMASKGYTKRDVDKFLEYCRGFMGYSYNKSHALGYAYLAMQTLYLKVYYPTYFYANLLNSEGNNESYQSIISDAVANGVKVLPPSITKSKYKFTVEDKSIRIGYCALKGFGDKAMEELTTLDLSKCSGIYEILTQPFKKVNSKAFQCLIDSGAFDEFGIEREKIEALKALYKDPKIEKWFSRKKGALTVEKMPPSLLEFKEEIVLSMAEKVKTELTPEKALIKELIPYVKVKLLTEIQRDAKEEEVLGFAMSTIEKLSRLLLLAEKYPDLPLVSLSTRENDSDLCYWFLMKKTISKTKKGKPYLTLDISDNSITIKAKCWDMIELEKGQAYVSNVKKDNWGYTIVVNRLLTIVPL